ncbi:MAG TPA: calcium/proton exchanger [Ignavibacteriaceae bacterium]
MKKFLKPSANWLFIFIPISLFLEYSHASAPLIFFSAALSIIPIAKLIVHSTEQLATYTGDAIGGLLNATFGNLPELIISIVALKAGLYTMVLASIIGAILANLLLALGLSFFIGGTKYHEQVYNPISARLYSTMMVIAVISMGVPSFFNRMFGGQDILRQQALLNVGLAIVLLIGYGLYLFFMIKTHPEYFKSSASEEQHEEHEKRWSKSRAIIFLIGASVLAAFMSEILVGAAEGTGEALGMSATFIGIVFLAIVGGAAESLSAITVAKKNKMDLSVGILLGSCIQITLFIAPLLVLVSLIISPEPLFLSFPQAQVGALFFAVLIGMVVVADGKSNWYKGIQLIAVYLIIALMFFFMPEIM